MTFALEEPRRSPRFVPRDFKVSAATLVNKRGPPTWIKLNFFTSWPLHSLQMVSEGKLQPLQRADGSASYSRNGYSVLAAVNGPVEVQRRDELPEEAAIDVIVRPAAGIGGTCFSTLELFSFHAEPSEVYENGT